MIVRVLAFARVRELLGTDELPLELAGDARVSDVWAALAHGCPELVDLTGTTRIARNGRVVSRDEPVAAGDELALLPPVGGG
jgi:molybdopterin converting factor small subunit